MRTVHVARHFAALSLFVALVAVQATACRGDFDVIPCISDGVPDKTKCEQCAANPTTCRSGCDAELGLCIYPRTTGEHCTNPGQCASQGCYYGVCQ